MSTRPVQVALRRYSLCHPLSEIQSIMSPLGVWKHTTQNIFGIAVFIGKERRHCDHEALQDTKRCPWPSGCIDLQSHLRFCPHQCSPYKSSSMIQTTSSGASSGAVLNVNCSTIPSVLSPSIAHTCNSRLVTCATGPMSSFHAPWIEANMFASRLGSNSLWDLALHLPAESPFPAPFWPMPPSSHVFIRLYPDAGCQPSFFSSRPCAKFWPKPLSSLDELGMPTALFRGAHSWMVPSCPGHVPEPQYMSPPSEGTANWLTDGSYRLH